MVSVDMNVSVKRKYICTLTILTVFFNPLVHNACNFIYYHLTGVCSTAEMLHCYLLLTPEFCFSLTTDINRCVDSVCDCNVEQKTGESEHIRACCIL
jgi:hypothetical protein